MNGEIPESDWKLLRKFHESALERYCEATIAAIGQLCIGPTAKFHERYLQIFELVDTKNDELGALFDNMLRRSVAISHILGLRRHGLIADNEFSQFTEEVQAKVNFMIDLQ